MSIKKSRKTFLGFSSIVRLIGLEPTRRETPDPKSGASTNFATGAKCNPLFALLPCKDSANRAKKKINLVYFLFRGAAYLIQSSANRAKKKINLVYFLFFALLNNPSEVPPILFKVVQTELLPLTAPISSWSLLHRWHKRSLRCLHP